MSDTDRARDPKKPENDPSANPTGARTYEDRAVSRPAQGPGSPGASEPGDLGGPRPGDEEAPPRESPAGDGGQGYRGG